ncbi:Glutamine synthetase [bioreactor metagenome]|uniref:Glutamine synthetase n=1 Tax=bioreactor metagenome TaxID=1076179 RepID=A0A645D0T0_9ZZZZ
MKNPEKRRFEFRPSDATANPYLAYSALLMAGIDGILNKINPTEAGFGPFDINVFDMPEEERNKIEALPTSLEEALEELKKDHEFLLKDGVFDKHFINNWIKFKYDKEVMKIAKVPSPIEFELYYDL